MMDDEYLLVVLAAIDDEDYRFRSRVSGTAPVTPEPEPPTGLNAFQTDAFENDAFE